MARRGHSTTIGKFAKIDYNRRRSEIRVLGELLRREQRAVSKGSPRLPDTRPDVPAR